jgi:cbb3-type cytochrome oxidase subunit 3
MKAFARLVYGRPLALLLLAVMLGGVHQWLFFEHEPGISFPLFVLLFYLFMYAGAKERLRPVNAFACYLGVVVALLALSVVVFDSDFFRGLNMLVVPGLALIHMAYCLDWRRPDWGRAGLVLIALDHLISQNLRHWKTAMELLFKSVTGRLEAKRRETLKGVLVGLAIACPLLAVVISLLASADGIFHHVLDGIPNWLAGLSLTEGGIRLLWTVVLGLCFFGYVYSYLHPEKEEEETEAVRKDREADALSGRTWGLNPVTAATVLALVNVVYVLFVAVQFSYLFGAWEGVLPEGVTYADYARKGFGELVAATVLNYLLLLTSLSAGEGSLQGTARFNRRMLYLLVGCSCVMLYSAYARLGLYEEAYGYTVLRFSVHAFMIFLVLLLVLAAVRVRMPRFPLIRSYIVLFLGAYVLMNFVGMESAVTRLNLERYEQSGKLDVSYLLTLSSDAVPRLSKLGGIVYPDLEERLGIKLELLREKRGWQEFNLSDYRAKHALEKRLAP